MKMKYISALCILFILAACKTQPTVDEISADNASLDYAGRVGYNADHSTEIYWSGSSVKINFEGTQLRAILQDEKGENYFNVITDGDRIVVINPSTQKRTYTLAENLPYGKHSIELYKRTEWIRGKTILYGFISEGGKFLRPDTTSSNKRIEFYGNSITCGYAVEDDSGNDSPDSTYTNHYLSYAALTARHFGAKMTCISHSGIGIMLSWFPSNIYYDYNKLNPEDSTSIWDFSKNVPDLVVINLCQNDSWLVKMPKHASFKATFGTQAPNERTIIDAYKEFVETIRSKYPKSQILCILGAMDITQEGSPWPGYVTQAVNELHDNKVSTFFIPYKKTQGHPNVEEQQVMADKLIQYIENHIEW